MSSPEFPAPPEGFSKYPAGNVIALMIDGDAVSAALDDLAEAGFARDKTYRIAGQIGGHEELLRTADHLQAGGLAMRVPATESDKSVAARILAQHGAVRIVYMGKWTFETLAS